MSDEKKTDVKKIDPETEAKLALRKQALKKLLEDDEDDIPMDFAVRAGAWPAL